MHTKPVEITIQIRNNLQNHAGAKSYLVYARSENAAAPRPSPFEFPLNKNEQQRYLEKLDYALFRSNTRFHNHINEYEDLVKEFGEILYKTIFATDAVTKVYSATREKAITEKRSIRISLHIEPDELANLPWELLYERDTDEFLCRVRGTSIVRYMTAPVTPPLLDVKPPLKILVILANPDIADVRRLDVQREAQNLEQALAYLKQEGFVEVEYVEDGTLESLHRKLLENEYHVIHFIGHAGYARESKTGVIIFCDPAGLPDEVTASKLRDVLSVRSESLRLMIINACESGRAGEDNMYSSVAGMLVLLGIPVVLSMQHPVRDTTAAKFAEHLYQRLANGDLIDIAVAEARLAMSTISQSSLEWVTPLVHLRLPDVRIFDLDNQAIKEVARQYKIEKDKLAKTTSDQLYEKKRLQEVGEQAKRRQELAQFEQSIRDEERRNNLVIQEEQERRVRQEERQRAEEKILEVSTRLRQDLEQQAKRTLTTQDKVWELRLKNSIEEAEQKAEGVAELEKIKWDREHRMKLADAVYEARKEERQHIQEEIAEMRQKLQYEIMEQQRQPFIIGFEQARHAERERTKQTVISLAEKGGRLRQMRQRPLVYLFASSVVVLLIIFAVFISRTLAQRESPPITPVAKPTTALIRPTFTNTATPGQTPHPEPPAEVVLYPTNTVTETALLVATATWTPTAIVVLPPLPLDPPTATAIPLPTWTPTPTSTPTSAPAVCLAPGTIITSPGMNQIISGTVAIVGRAVHPQFQSYKLEYIREGMKGFAYFAGNPTPVENGELGKLNTTNLPNGQYMLQLTVVDQQGNFPSPCQVAVSISN